MSRADKEATWRMEGLGLAYKVVCEATGENSPAALALKREMKFRQRSGIYALTTRKELAKNTEQIKQLTIQTVMAMSMIIMWGEFGFGQKRLARFKAEFDRYATALVKDEIDWLDVLDSLEAATNIRIVLPDELLGQ